jgi:hypothetical protein
VLGVASRRYLLKFFFHSADPKLVSSNSTPSRLHLGYCLFDTYVTTASFTSVGNFLLAHWRKPDVGIRDIQHLGIEPWLLRK